MKIQYLYIDGYKNLNKVEFFFEDDCSVNAIIGNNGSGKSNVLEALTIIFAAAYNNKTVDFTYDVVYSINEARYQISNKDGEVFLKNSRAVTKNERQKGLPRNLFIYYCGETDRLKSLALSYIDKAFDNALKNYNDVRIKYITYTGLREFPPAMLSTALYQNEVYDLVCDIVGIETVIPPVTFHFHRPESWGKNAPTENFWNAKGTVASIIGKLLEVGRKELVDKDHIDIIIERLKDVRLESETGFELFIMLELLMQAGVLETVEYSVLKDGREISITELSEGEKQLSQLLCLLELTKEYRVLFLLDEFDSFLHPGWQRKFSDIISGINITGQVIFTTHSPLTLGKMKKDSIRILKGGKVFIPAADTFNRDISEVLEEIMDVGKRPVDVDAAIKAFRNAAVHGNLTDAESLLIQLRPLLSPEDPFWITAEHLMARMKIK